MSKIICPLCKNECNTVNRNIIDASVKKHFKKHIKSREYGFCQNSDCDILYFGLESDEMYFKRDVDEVVK
jgi:hypothetical protein